MLYTETENPMADIQQDTTETTDAKGQDTTSEEKGVDLQAEVDKWKALSRKHEERAKENYAKATEYDKYLESQKTVQQKQEEATAQLKTERDEALVNAALATAALKHGLSADDLDLIRGGTPEEIEARAERLAERLKAAPRATPDSQLGREKTPTGSGDWLGDQFRK